MDVISVEVTYPSVPQSALQTPPCTPQPLLPPLCFGSNPVTTRKGLAGYYDIYEISEELRVFGISDQMRKALLPKREKAPRTPSRWMDRKASISASDAQYTDEPLSLKSQEQSRKQLLHSAAARSCYVDFTSNFHDAVRAQSVKMSTKNSTPPVHPNASQRIIPTTSKPKQSRRKKQQDSASKTVQIREGLLVIANGQVVDFREDVKRSQKLDKRDRKTLRKEMREHLDIVRSFDNALEKFDATKMRIEQMKSR